mmetsp:Transcript_20884/g.32253  ORF Transcript_20884/g.32253 Transcript_20884/m.32253 type:complete len:140 (+) Transcript_20884:880-1299(+)
MTWEVGYAYNKNATSLYCTYDESDCYSAKTVPVITTMSSHTGYKTGGQILDVTGYGFTSGNIDATIDGKTCEVQSYSAEAFSCKVGVADAESVIDTPTTGLNGVSVFHFTSENLLDSSYSHKFMKTEFESFYNAMHYDA